MSREVRKVPADWVHPTKADGSIIPLLEGSYAEACAHWWTGWLKWQEGLVRDYANGGWEAKPQEYDTTTFTDYYGEIPSPDEYMPEWTDEQATHLMMYETVSEGTPISPAFETPEELARWLVDNNASAFAGETASYEGWLRVAQGGFAPTAVMTVGGSMQSGVDGLD